MHNPGAVMWPVEWVRWHWAQWQWRRRRAARYRTAITCVACGRHHPGALAHQEPYTLLCGCGAVVQVR